MHYLLSTLSLKGIRESFERAEIISDNKRKAKYYPKEEQIK